MKNRVFIFLICLSSISAKCFAQVKKVYAYKQPTISGNIIANDENDIKGNNGARPIERKQNFNYWFYLSIPKKEKVAITGLWIDGKQYDIKQDSINDLPVKKIIYTGLQKNDTIIMAPVTSNKVVLIYPATLKTNDSKYVLNLTRINELVIRYTWKNRTYYTSIKKIKELTPDVRV